MARGGGDGLIAGIRPLIDTTEALSHVSELYLTGLNHSDGAIL